MFQVSLFTRNQWTRAIDLEPWYLLRIRKGNLYRHCAGWSTIWFLSGYLEMTISLLYALLYSFIRKTALSTIPTLHFFVVCKDISPYLQTDDEQRLCLKKCDLRGHFASHAKCRRRLHFVCGMLPTHLDISFFAFFRIYRRICTCYSRLLWCETEMWRVKLFSVSVGRGVHADTPCRNKVL